MTNPAGSTASSGLPFPKTPEIIFANWPEALHQSRFSPGIQAVDARANHGYPECCAHHAISVGSASAPGLYG